MKVLYLFNRVKKQAAEDVRAGLDCDNSFFGMFRLPHHGVQAGYLELEQFYPAAISAFLRRLLGMHFAHMPLLPRFRQYDFVFTSTAFGCLLAKAALGLRRPKWVVFDYSIAGLIGNRTNWRQRMLHRIVSRAADGIVTISEHEAERARELFPHLASRITFIPLGTDIGYFSPDDTIADGGVLTVGKDPYRDYSTLLSAVAMSGLPCTIVTNRPELIAPFQPLPGTVTMRTASAQSLREEYGRARIFALSLSTTSGRNDAVGCSTLVEAMAMGKAIVATKTSTMEAYIEDGVSGVLVPEGDAEAMATAIRELWGDEAKRRRLGEAARRFAVEQLDAERFAGALACFFKSVIGS